MERFNFDELATEDDTLHLDIRNIESKSRDYKEWNKLAKDLIDRGNRYKFLYEKSKSEYAKEKLESIFAKSIVCSDKSIELNPRNIDSWYNNGLAHGNLGEYEKAIKCYDRVIEIDPDYFPVWNLKGNALNYLGKFQEAIKSYDQVLEKDPQNIIAFYNKGLALSNLSEYEKAIKCYDRVLEIDHENIDALNAKGLAFERLHKYEEAIKCYDRVIEIDHENIEALNSKGYALDRLDRYEEAQQYYKKVSEVYLNEINNLNEEAEKCQNLHKYEEAIIYYDRIISIDANNSNAWLKKGVLLYNLDKYEEAIECYDRIIGLDKYKEKFKRNGQELTGKQVIEYYKSIETNPRNIEALNEKGNALEKLGKYDEAIQLFDLVIEKNPHFVIDTIIKNGDIFMTLGKYKAAEKRFNDALQRDPNNIFALNKLHTLYSNCTFQYDKAISISQLLLKNLSISQIQNSDKLINYVDTKSQREKFIKYVYTKSKRKKNLQVKQKNLLNEEILDVKFLLSEDYIKNGNYKQGRKIAKETIKDIPKESIKRQIIVRFLIIASYLLQGKKGEGIFKLDKFLTYYRNLDIDIKIEENQWNFKGLINAINKNKNINGTNGEELIKFGDNLSTKSILRNLIDLLCGFTDSYKILLKTTVETIDKIDKTKIRKKIEYTVIISLVIVAILGILYSQLNVAESCSVLQSRTVNLGNAGSTPIGIDFNPITNKAYIANEKDRTISVLDCTAPRYSHYLNNNNKIEVEDKIIQLKSPPFDIAVNPTTNKIYVLHQLPSPSLSVIDGNNNYQKLPLNIPVGKNPLDIAVNTNSNKVYVANSGDDTVSVIDGKTDQLINEGIDVGSKPNSVGVNPTTNKVYVSHQGSNNVSVIDETKEKDNIKNISLPYRSIADLNINSKTNKVYVTHPINNTISIIDGISDTKIKEINVGDTPIRIDIDSEADKVFVVNQGSDSISVIDGTKDTIIKILKVPSDKPYDVEFNSDINSVYVMNVGSNSRGTIDVIKLDDDRYLNYIHAGDQPVDIDVNPKTKKTYVVNYGFDTLSIINSTNKVEEIIDVGDKPRSIVVNPTTNKIYVTHQSLSPSLSVIDGNNNYQKLPLNIPVGKDPLDIAVDTKLNKVYVANYGDGTVSVIDGNTDQLINEGIDVGDKPIRIAVNPNSNKVYVANYGDGTVSVIDGKTDQLINKSMVVDENPNSIEVNPNTNKVYVGYSNQYHLSVIDGKSDRLLVDKNKEKVKIGLTYPCPSDIAINQETNQAYVSFDCKDHIFLINESNAVIPTKTSTLGTKNTDIVFNPATNKIYVLDTQSNIVHFKDVSEL